MVNKPPRFYGEQPEVEREIPVKATLESEVAKLLATSFGVDASDVRVMAVEEGDVFLEGTVSLPGEVEKASEIAASVPGVRNVFSRVQASPAMPAIGEGAKQDKAP